MPPHPFLLLRQLILCLSLLLLLTPPTHAFQFYLQAGERRCFTESAAPNAKVLAEYTVSTGKGSMPVDIAVRMDGRQEPLYARKNVDHGKFAFVVPYESNDVARVHRAEIHRKLADQLHRSVKRHGRAHARRTRQEEGVGGRGVGGGAGGRRRLLAAEEPADADGARARREGGAQQRAGEGEGGDRGGWNGQTKEHEQHDGGDDYDYDDELDDFDAENYDGIGDEEMDRVVAQNEEREREAHGRPEDASAEEEESRLFDLRKFEICVENVGMRADFRRRVRLLVNKGEMAHDYTRLAKKEHMSQLEISLKQVSGELHELMLELDRARRMEDILRKLNENTNKRVVLLAFVSLFSMFAVGGYQALYTKRFFKRKKIL